MTLRREFLQTDYLIRKNRPPHLTGTDIVQVKDLTVRYENNLALDHLSFELKAAERVAVVGPNGAGKSTLFKVIAGMLTPNSGEVRIYGQEPGGHICVAYLPQRSQVDWNFPVTVADVVMMGRIGMIGLLRWPKRHDRTQVDRALAMVGLADLAGRQISQLSGGQQQRMFIARALAQQAELMLMDEPLNGLDLESQEMIFDIMEQLRQEGVTVVTATHDLNQAAERFDRMMLLNHRLIAMGEPEDVITTNNLLEAYGGRLRLVKTSESDLLALSDTCCDEAEEHTHA